jgi:hypothetical protein
MSSFSFEDIAHLHSGPRLCLTNVPDEDTCMTLNHNAIYFHMNVKMARSRRGQYHHQGNFVHGTCSIASHAWESRLSECLQ